MRLTMLFLTAISANAAFAEPLEFPSDELYTQEDAEKMLKGRRGTLAPVYAPLADQIVADFELADKQGIGIDLGSGPGALVIELCRRTDLHWVNADINPHFFPHFYQAADKAGFGPRVSAVFADAHRLPFRDNYADIIVSRGCFFFWEDKPLAFSEVYRVLKPGGIAYIGRGMARDFPVESARTIREKQKGKKILQYEPEEMAEELGQALETAGIDAFTVECPRPESAPDLHYGVWVTIRKPNSPPAAAVTKSSP